MSAVEYRTPGVYVKEVSRGNKPIESVGTSVCAFIGESAKGPVNEVHTISNWSEYTRLFGGFEDAPHLAHAVYGWFLNGGGLCYVNNVGGGAPAKAPAKSDKAAPKQKDSGDAVARLIGKDEGPGKRSGLHAFDHIEEISLVAAPGFVSKEAHEALIAHCENEERRDRFAILDGPEELEGGLQKLYRPRDTSYAAYYWPWIEVYDPTQKKNIAIPPSGHIAGVYSRTDSDRGVHKAPANEIVRGAVGLKYSLSRGEQGILNPRGVNVVRDFGDRGLRIWGARTLASDPEWRYINVRRLFLMVEESIDKGTQWCVFEPNDRTLWKKITRNLTAYLRRLWQDGALTGADESEAFYVKCDQETNPKEVVDQGMVIVEIGLAPVKPAEFVVFRIGQMAGEE